MQLYSTLVCTLERDTYDQNYVWINKIYKWKEVRQVELKVFQFITFFVTKDKNSKNERNSKSNSKSKTNQIDEKISKIAGTDENKQENKTENITENKTTNELENIVGIEPENKTQNKAAESTNENKASKKSNGKTENHRQINNESCSSQLFLVNKHAEDEQKGRDALFRTHKTYFLKHWNNA